MSNLDDAPRPDHITVSEILAINDVLELEDMHADLISACSKIETELEWSDRDDEWAGRARGALSHKRGQVSACERRIKALKASAIPAASVEKAIASAAKAQADAIIARTKAETKAAGQATFLENARIARQKAREDNFKRGVALIENISFERAFYKAARKMLTPDKFESIEYAAHHKTIGAARTFVEDFQRAVEAAE